MDVLRRSTKQRRKATTGLNYASSRSHSVFTIAIKWADVSAEEPKRSHMYFVDLAGQTLPLRGDLKHQ